MYLINLIFISIYIQTIHCLEEEITEGDGISLTTPIQPLDDNEEIDEGEEMMPRDEIADDQAPVYNKHKMVLRKRSMFFS